MSENEVIVLVGRDLFRIGVALGMGAAVGVFVAIGIYQLVATVIDKALARFSKTKARAEDGEKP